MKSLFQFAIVLSSSFLATEYGIGIGDLFESFGLERAVIVNVGVGFEGQFAVGGFNVLEGGGGGETECFVVIHS